MNIRHLPILAGAVLLAPHFAFGFAEIARGELDLKTTAKAAYDSRIFGGENSGSDYIFTLYPELTFRRDAGQLKLDSYAGVRVNRYVDYTQFNSEDLNAALNLNLPPDIGAPASGSFDASYIERTDINYDVNRRLREKTFFTRGNAEIPLGLKMAFLVGGSYAHELRNLYTDRDTWTGSGAFRYTDFLGGTSLELRYRRLEVDSTRNNIDFTIPDVPINQQSDIYTATLSRPIYGQVEGSLTYGWRELHRSAAEVPGADPNSGGSIIALNIDGPFLPRMMFPKLKSSFMIAYQKEQTPGINDLGGRRLIGNAQLSWQAREETNLFIDVHRSVELSVSNLTVTADGFDAGVHEDIGHFWTTSLTGGYEHRHYDLLARADDIYTFQADAVYRITRAWSANFDYSFRQSNSNYANADYARHIVAVSATYTF